LYQIFPGCFKGNPKKLLRKFLVNPLDFCGCVQNEQKAARRPASRIENFAKKVLFFLAATYGIHYVAGRDRVAVGHAADTPPPPGPVSRIENSRKKVLFFLAATFSTHYVVGSN